MCSTKKSVTSKLHKTALAIAISAVSLSGMASETPVAGSFSDAVANGNVDLNFRYRFENVDQDNAKDNARASTLKSRITYTTQKYNNFQGQIEVDDVTVLGGENHNDFSNGMADHSVVADPEGTEVNQAWISFSGIDDTTVKAGRQRINMDNQRFIGGVGWRQNEQTYDGVTVVNTSFDNTTIVYGYIDNVNRIFGPGDSSKAVDLDTAAHALNINVKELGIGALSLYNYSLDVKDADALSTQTTGIRLAGDVKGEKHSLLYTLEYARQSDYANNPGSYDADYYLLEAGLKCDTLTAKLGYEVLEGNEDTAGEAFQTPLATLHKFNGWADQFLSTPGAGIEDAYVSVSGKLLGAKVTAAYHQFDAQDGNMEYGSEFDLSAAIPVAKNLNLLVKFADYNADEHKVDTQKLWLQLQYKL